MKTVWSKLQTLVSIHACYRQTPDSDISCCQQNFKLLKLGVSSCILRLYVSDFVDALSAPIQFLSQAEKRAKQLEGLGIVETDITDVSMSLRQKQEPPQSVTSTVSTQPLTGITISTTANRQPAPQSTASNATQPTVADKDRKGAQFRLSLCVNFVLKLNNILKLIVSSQRAWLWTLILPTAMWLKDCMNEWVNEWMNE